MNHYKVKVEVTLDIEADSPQQAAKAARRWEGELRCTSAGKENYSLMWKDETKVKDVREDK